MGFIKGIGKAFKKIGSFAKKAVGFASKILNGPIGKIASFIPGVGPFIAGASKIVGIANGVLNGGGLKGIVGGLVDSFGGGLLGKAGSLLSKTGLGSVIGLGSQANSTGGVLDLVKGLMSSRQNDQSAAAQGDKYNLSQFAAFKVADLLRSAA
jgi:phage-related protein